MSYCVSSDTKDLGKFSTTLGYSQLMVAAAGKPALEALFDDGWTEDVDDCVKELREVADAGDENVSDTANGLADLIVAETFIMIHNGVGEEETDKPMAKALGAAIVVKASYASDLQKGNAGQDHVQELAKVIREFLHSAGKQVAAKVREYGAGLKKAASPVSPDDDVETLLSKILPIDWSALPAKTQAILKKIAQESGAKALAQVHITDQDIFSDVNDAAAEWAYERAAEMVGMKWVDGELVTNPDAKWAIDETTRNMIRDIVTEAFEGPMTIQELASSIEDAGAFSEVRAMLIARTESAKAAVSGQIDGWKKSGVVAKVGWQTGADHDENSDCNCSDNRDDSPYDLSDVPEYPDHPNDNCDLYPVLAGEEGSGEEADEE